MNPQLNDTVADRYTLTNELRVQPGFSAWLAHDSSLEQDCQLFLVSDPALLARTNALTSSLVLSNNPYFTQVRQLLRDGDDSIIVTEIDKGISIHELLEHGMTFGTEGIRTVVNELCDAVSSLLEVSLTHQGIFPGTVRLFDGGIQLADAPVSCAIQQWPMPLSLPDEPLAVKQIAGVLFAMVTGEEFAPETMHELPDSFHAGDVPSEYAVICSRALGLVDPAKGKPAKKLIEILTLRELKVLLGDPVPFDQLGDDQLPVIDHSGAASIEQIPLVPTKEAEGRAERDAKKAEERLERADESKDSKPSATWDAGQLLFAGPRAVEPVKPADDDTNILAPLSDAPAPAAVEPEPEGENINSRQTVMLNVGQIRQSMAQKAQDATADGGAAADADDADDEATVVISEPIKAPAAAEGVVDQPAIPERPGEHEAHEHEAASVSKAEAKASLASLVAETRDKQAGPDLEAKAEADLKADLKAEQAAAAARTPEPALPEPSLPERPHAHGEAHATSTASNTATSDATFEEHGNAPAVPAANVKPLIEEELPPSFAPTYPPQRTPYEDDFLTPDSVDASEEANSRGKGSLVRNIIAAIIGIIVFAGVLYGGITLLGMFSGGSSNTPSDNTTTWPGIDENNVPFPGKTNGNSSNGALAGGTIDFDVADGFAGLARVR